jgi:hypothetical protein
MRYIAHSVRSAAEVKQLPSWFGVHLEIRDRGSRLIVQPEPFQDGEDLESLLQQFDHSLLVVQVKSEGIAPHVLRVLELFNVQNYMLLGCSPSMRAALREQDEKSALRVSDYEPAEWALAQAGHAEWVWVEGLQRGPLARPLYADLKRRFKLCIASPETQGGAPASIADFARQWHHLPVDAVCTKRPDLWQAALSQLSAEDAANDVADQESLLSLLRQAA